MPTSASGRDPTTGILLRLVTGQVLAVVVILVAASVAAAGVNLRTLGTANVDFGRVCTDQAGTYTDKTTAAGDTTENDVTMGDNSLNQGSDGVYFGGNYVFKEVDFDVGTTGVGGTVVWTYWNGSTWGALTAVDSTVGFTVPGVNTVLFTPPSNWATKELNASTCAGAKYYIRAVTNLNYATLPKANQMIALQYNLKVQVQTELGSALTLLGQSAFTVSGGTTNTVFAYREIGSGVYEFALDTFGADVNFDVSVQKTGYVTTVQATGSLTNSLTDKTGSPISMPFGVKITVDDEMAENHLVAGATVRTGDGTLQACVEPTPTTGSYYCSIPLIETGTDVKVVKDGYVTKTVTNAYADRIAHTDPQRVVTFSDLQFGYKVTGVTSETSAALALGTVTIGDAFGTTCDEDGSTGVYYCAVPLLDTATIAKYVRAGYVDTQSASVSDRFANTDAQVPLSISGVPYTVKVSLAREAGSALSDLAGVTFRSSVAGGAYASSTPTATSGTNAFWAQDPAAGTFVIEAAKTGYVTTTTGAAFTPSAASQTSRTITLPFTYKLAHTGVTDLSGVSWQKAVGGGAFAAVTADATSVTNAFFAQDPAQGSVQFKAIRGSITATATAFTASATSQVSHSVALSDSEAPTAPTALASATHPANAWKTSKAVTVTWTAATDNVGVTGYSYALDATPDDTSDTTALTATISNVADGTHTFNVKARDADGNWGPVAAFSNIKIDATAPTAGTISSATHAASVCVANTDPSFAWTAGSDGGSGLDASQPYGYALDSGTVTRTNLLAKSLTSVASGSHTFTVTVYDAAGNTASATYAFKVDKEAPTVSLTAPLYAKTDKASLTWVGSDACSGVASYDLEFRFKGGDWKSLLAASTLTSKEFTFDQGDGLYEFRARAKDGLGFLGTYPTSAMASTTVDRVAPSAAGLLQIKVATGVYVQLEWKAGVDNAGGSGLAGYNLYKGASADQATTKINAQPIAELNYTDSGNADGTLVFYTVRAVDKAGNEGPLVPPLGLLINSKGPSVTPKVIMASNTVLTEAGALAGKTWSTAWYAQDGDGDGQFDSFVDPAGVLKPLRQGVLDRSFPFYLLGSDADADLFLMWRPAQQDVVPVVPLDAQSEGAVLTNKYSQRIQTVQVEGKQGWIYVTAEDAVPAARIVRVESSNGTVIPSSQIWRENGAVYFLDDPVTTYRIIYAPLGAPTSGDAATPWIVYVVLGALLALGLSTVGLARWWRNHQRHPQPSLAAAVERTRTPEGFNALTLPLALGGFAWRLTHCKDCGTFQPPWAWVLQPCANCRRLSTLHEKLLARRGVEFAVATAAHANPTEAAYDDHPR